jgi:hypothetical protein
LKTRIKTYQVEKTSDKVSVKALVTEQVIATAREVVNLTVNNIEAVFGYVPPPPTRDSPGIPGQQSFDDDFHYICVAPNLWARSILTKGW